MTSTQTTSQSTAVALSPHAKGTLTWKTRSLYASHVRMDSGQIQFDTGKTHGPVTAKQDRFESAWREYGQA